jgi:L-rhamnose mutarotase
VSAPGGRRLVAMHTVLRPGAEGDYDAIHERIPEEVAVALRANGVHEWRIWRDGLHLFHLIDVDDYQAMRRALASDPANQRWQATVAPLLDVPDDYSGSDDGLAEVWRLSEQD